ncbi:MAG: restriction endonuclease subunit S [Oceanobacter sp.]
MSEAITSPFGKLPEDWSYRPVEQYTDFLTGPAFDSKRFNTDGKGPRLVRGINLTKGVTRWEDEKTKFWSHNLDGLTKYSLKEKDILIGMDGSLVGQNYAYLNQSDLPALLVQRVARIRVNGKLDSKFLYYMFGTDSWLKYVEIVKTNSGIPHISNGDIKNFVFPFPPLPEQQKIATILSSVDDVIEKTQSQIDKLKDLKTGMMQELLTKGIGHTEFKDSPVGRIPVGWDRVSIQSVTHLITKGATPTTYGHAYTDSSGVYFYRSVNASEDGTLKREDIRFISNEANESIKRSKLQVGDIALSIVGAKTGKTYFCVTSQAELPANINQNVALIRPIEERLNHRYLKYVIASADFQYQVDMEITTQAQPSLSLKQVGDFMINLPPITEQMDISDKLDSVSTLILAKQRKMVAISKSKKALMQDLLTGTVRVNVDNQHKEEVVA